MRWLICSLVLFLSVAPLPRVEADDAPEIRVMSFNIRFGSANDGDNSWPHRKEMVAETIRKFNPDLLGTQETLPFQADYLEEQIPGYTRIGWSRDASENGEQCTIFFRTDRFEQVDAGQFWLSESPDEKFSKSWDSSLPRVATWVILRDRQNKDREVVFANTHFDHRGSKARRMSAQLIHDRAWQLQGAPLILTGDFNCAEGSEPWRTLTSSGLFSDTRRVAHPQANEAEGTFNGFRNDGGTRRIDWVLTSQQFEVVSAEIDRTQRDGRYPSDHFPVTAILRRR